MSRLSVVAVALVCAASLRAAVRWSNVDAAHYLAGRKASEGYLVGKVVLVDRWGAKCPPCRAMLPQVEQIWQSFKTKPFVVLGGHCEGWGSADEVRRIVEEKGLTYPIYEGARLSEGEPPFDGIPFLYVVDETGLVVYKGRNERIATQAIVTALTDMEAPRNLRQWRRFLDYELEALPGRAYLRLEEFRKKVTDIFGPMPRETEELMQTIPLRMLAADLHFEKIILKKRTFHGYFTGNSQSRYFQSDEFGKFLLFMQANHPVVQLKEANHKLVCSIHNIPTFKAAYHWLGKMRDAVEKEA